MMQKLTDYIGFIIAGLIMIAAVLTYVAPHFSWRVDSVLSGSMEPELKDGDTVLVDQSQKAILAGAVYAVGIDDTVMVKRLEKHPNKLVLLSDNETYSPIYLQGDEKWLSQYLDRINQIRPAGFCLTVDTPVYSRRERDLYNRYTPAGREEGEREGFSAQSRMTWDFVQKVRNRLEVPLILKGIQSAEDADLAVARGVDVVYVSNHGGRQLDHGLGSMDVLTEVVKAVGDRVAVYVDGGMMRGSDVLKALALGAKAVGIGKLQALALAAGGKQGLLAMLEILETEITINMGLLGVTSLDELDATYVQPVQPVKNPDFLNPFPSLQERLK